MKKQLLLFFGVLIAMLASADNYFTVGENDTLRINPMYLNSTIIVPVHAHLDGLSILNNRLLSSDLVQEE